MSEKTVWFLCGPLRSLCLCAGSLALCLALGGCKSEIAAPEGAPDGELWLPKDAIDKGRARVASAADHQFAQAVIASGRIAFDDARVAHVFSPVNGRIARVLARLGQSVTKGQPLLALVSPDMGSAAADLVKARADLAAARRELTRQKQLAEVRAGSQRDLEAAESAFEKSRAEEGRTAQRARLLRAGSYDAVTQEYVLRSPIDGQVVARSVSPGGEVQGQYSGGSAVELFTIGNVDKVWAIADVAEADLPDVAQGAEVSVSVIAWPGQSWKGRVEWISSALDPALRTARVRCALQNDHGRLKPEMYATLSVARPARTLLGVPAKAVVQVNDLAFVQLATGRVTADGRPIFRRQRVRVADDRSGSRRDKAQKQVLEMRVAPAEGEALLPITEGLKANDQVLVQVEGAREPGNEEAALSAAQLDAAGIRVEAAEKRALPDSVLAGGRLTFDDLAVAHVLSPVTGRVLRVLASAGQHVSRGAPLAVVASPDLAAAEADLAKARAELSAAVRDQGRQRELVEAGAGARRDLEIAEDRHRSALAEERRAALRARSLQQGGGGARGEYVVRSPLEGEVIARSVSPGMEVQGQYAGGAAAVELFTVGSLRELWVVADVFEMDLPRVVLGERIEIEAQGQRYRGRIDWISDALDPATRTAKVRCVIDNERARLRPEMYQPVRISVAASPVLAVPRDSVLRLGDETVLFVEGAAKDKEGRSLFKRRRVLAREGDPTGMVPIFAGLTAGERVVTRGAIFLAGAL